LCHLQIIKKYINYQFNIPTKKKQRPKQKQLSVPELFKKIAEDNLHHNKLSLEQQYFIKNINDLLAKLKNTQNEINQKNQKKYIICNWNF